MEAERIYYSMEGFPCSKEYFEREIKVYQELRTTMDEATKNFPKKNLGRMMIFSTAGEVNDLDFSLDNTIEGVKQVKLFTQVWEQKQH